MINKLKSIVIKNPFSSIILIILVIILTLYIIQLSSRLQQVEENMERMIETQREVYQDD